MTRPRHSAKIQISLFTCFLPCVSNPYCANEGCSCSSPMSSVFVVCQRVNHSFWVGPSFLLTAFMSGDWLHQSQLDCGNLAFSTLTICGLNCLNSSALHEPLTGTGTG